MVRCYRLPLYIALLFLSGSGYADELDPGEPDTVRIHESRLLVGQSRPVPVSIFNDSIVFNWTAYFEMTAIDSGFARFDSVHFVGRMADPAVLGVRFVTDQGDGTDPDSLLLAALINVLMPLPPGDGPVAELYFTGLRSGQFLIDTIRHATAGVGLGLSTPGESMYDLREYIPAFTTTPISIEEAPPPPEVAIIQELPVVGLVQEELELELDISSPYGAPTQASLVALTDVDNESRQPWSTPEFDSSGTPTLTWTPDQNDIGIWEAEFLVTDTAGSQTSVTAEIQIVESQSYALELSPQVTTGAPLATGLTFGNFDNDRRFELLMTAIPALPLPSLAVYDFLMTGGVQKVYEDTEDLPRNAPAVGFIDSDNRLDAVFNQSRHIMVAQGRGDNSFDIYPTGSWGVYATRGGVLADCNRDRYLDYVEVGSEEVRVFLGENHLEFTDDYAIALSSPGLSIQSGDFDRDGYDDLAVGTVSGLDIYANDGQGGYEQSGFYEQQFGTADIEVTGAGSDFNNDDLIDLCLANPSVGGTSSELVVYLGNGDATFTPTLVRTVSGQTAAVCAGDFNGDTELDIAYLNSSKSYLGILFGDGQGSFVNELRFAVPLYAPRHLTCFDVDLDGDLDAIVSSSIQGSEDAAAIIVYDNSLDPYLVGSADIFVRGCDNVDLGLWAPSGSRIDRRVNSIASAAIYGRALNDNDSPDLEMSVGTVEPGRYEIVAEPRAGIAGGEPFALSYSIGIDTFRVALDLPMSETGWTFPVYFSGPSPLSPRQGEFIQSSLPTFTWEAAGVERFELATDIEFTNIIETAVVSQGVYTPQMVLPSTDSTAYFWRVYNDGQEPSDEVFAFNAVRSPTDVEEPDNPPTLPDSCWLAQNYPNPFNPHTSIRYHVAQSGTVRISIHNVLGQLIRVLVDVPMPSGTYTIDWDATDLNGRPVASGIYFYHMEIGEFAGTRKMVLVR